MSSYRDLAGLLQGKTDSKILILDSNNLQFYYQHQMLMPATHIFAPYDLILIPGWVYAEYSHHTGKDSYVKNDIPTTKLYIDEVNDYLPMLEHSDKKLMELFATCSTAEEAYRFFGPMKKLQVDDYPDDWIVQFYNNGFPMQQKGTLLTRKNAGEISIITLAFSLLSHFQSNIASITLASSDKGSIRLKEKVLSVANQSPLELNIHKAPPISFLTTEVSMFNAVKSGILDPNRISTLRPTPRSSIYVEHHADMSSTIHDIVVDTASFINMCQNHQNYTIVY